MLLLLKMFASGAVVTVDRVTGLVSKAIAIGNGCENVGFKMSSMKCAEKRNLRMQYKDSSREPANISNCFILRTDQLLYQIPTSLTMDLQNC